MAGQNKQPVAVTDMLKIQSIGNVTLSPDGSKAAFTVMTIENNNDSKPDYKYVTQVWMVSAWIVAHDHRFKAACSRSNVAHLGIF